MGSPSRLPVVYVAGPLSAPTVWFVERNIRAAEEVGLAVAELGAMPLIPHSMTRFFHGTKTGAFWLEGTLELLRRCDAVVLVPGWERSQGTKGEVEEARRLELSIFEWGCPGDRDDFARWVASWGPPAPRVASRAGSARLGGIGEGESRPAPRSPCCYLCTAPAERLTRMIACPACGNKRCPKGTYHRLECRGSNDEGQPGSRYAEGWQEPSEEERLTAGHRQIERIRRYLSGEFYNQRAFAADVEALISESLTAEKVLPPIFSALGSKLKELGRALQEIERQAAGLSNPTTATRHIRTLALVALGRLPEGEAGVGGSTAPCPGSARPEGPPKNLFVFSPCAVPLCCPPREEGGEG